MEPCLSTALAIKGISGTVLSVILVSVSLAKVQLPWYHVYKNVYAMSVFLSIYLYLMIYLSIYLIGTNNKGPRSRVSNFLYY